MSITMVKKRLANGEACAKCDQAEQMLKNRGLWDRIDDVVWAVENEPESEGMRLGAQHGVDTAPFFIVRDETGEERVYSSVIKFAKTLTEGEAPEPSPSHAASAPFNATASATALRDKSPREVVAWGLDRFGADCAIAFSGAEDVVLIHMAVETGKPFSVFTLDTGRLHADTYRFIDRIRKHYGIEIDVMSPDTQAVQAFVRKKGLFSFYDDGHEECCGIRKVEPLRRALRGYRAWMTGQRKDQSPATRAGIPIVQHDPTFEGRDGSLVKFNPLAAWSSAQTWAYIQENSVPYNALHEKGFVSIGCEPCTRAILPGEHERAGRWWWEESTKRECGLHIGNITQKPE